MTITATRPRTTRAALGMPTAEAFDRATRLHARRAGELAMVHSWDLSTSADGPGTRMTLFLSGCPLRCLYCQNPDTWLERNGTPVLLDDVLARVERYAAVFRATGGGLTVSGGEPLQQAAFVERLFDECRKRGIRTALDTSGFLGANASDALLDRTDLVLLDVKSGLPDVYSATTGSELEPTIAFGERLHARGTPVWVRFVLVPGLTDSWENVEAVADLVAPWTNVERVEVLPFHQLGRSKWDELGEPYRLADTRSPDAELVERVRGQFRARGLEVY
ncbi:pyruvate formate-lyase-activating protein [Agromyces larvae]|uniref:Pyruvate formate-lyase-activating enzyme n=1 Tax=Agromyces larvae TaxID=2929802 RepID=A0ABY4C2N7_9MICO|nr:pyruvate formate-lyase-activating protein [Agromyces larvae]UOE44702.1 pyruvate formate-lyase-activating protein [Agromyces larvae]